MLSNINSKSKGFLDSLRGSKGSSSGWAGLPQDSEAQFLKLSDSEGDESPHTLQHGRSDSTGGQKPVGLLAAAYNNEPLPDVDQPTASTSGTQLQPTTKPWQPNNRTTKPNTFDRYGTFPDLLGDEAHIQGTFNDSRGPISQRSSSGNLAQQNETITDHEIVPLYVIPLFRHQIVVIPVPRDAPEGDQKGPEWFGKVVQTGQAVQKKAAETWDSLRKSDPDSLKGKVYRAGQAQIENLSPEQRLLGGIPDYAKKLKIIHAPAIDAEDILEYMSNTIKKLGMMERVRQVATGTLLPFTFLLDTVVIPGPGILTGITGYKCYHYSKAAAGSQRLKKFVDKEEGVAESAEMSLDDMDFYIDRRLQKYYNVDRDDEGILLESTIDELSADLGCPELAPIAHQLRRQYLRSKGKLPVYDSNGSI